MPERKKNIFIGLFVFASLLITLWIILFMEPTIGDGKKIFRARFSNITGVNVGTRVMLAGRAVGEVVHIQVVPHSRQDITDALGRVYFYELTLKVDSSVEIYNTDEVAIQTTGLLGEKSIGIIPKAPRKGQVPQLITHQIIYAESIDPLENALHQVSLVAEKAETAISDIDQWFVENKEELSRSVSSFADTMKDASTLLDSINQQNLVCSTKKAIDSFSRGMDLAGNTLQEVQDKQMVTKVDTILDNFSETSKTLNKEGKEILQNVQQITKDVADGSGSLGKFIKNDDFYLRMTSVMSKVDTLMNDINHYGLLFQYDKHWQRIRTKRANLLQALQKPSEFKNYFSTEIDGITTSLARISILLENAKEQKNKEQIFCNAGFKKDFAELLNKTEELLDSIKLYNEELSFPEKK